MDTIFRKARPIPLSGMVLLRHKAARALSTYAADTPQADGSVHRLRNRRNRAHRGVPLRRCTRIGVRQYPVHAEYGPAPRGCKSQRDCAALLGRVGTVLQHGTPADARRNAVGQKGTLLLRSFPILPQRCAVMPHGGILRHHPQAEVSGIPLMIHLIR